MGHRLLIDIQQPRHCIRILATESAYVCIASAQIEVAIALSRHDKRAPTPALQRRQTSLPDSIEIRHEPIRLSAPREELGVHVVLLGRDDLGEVQCGLEEGGREMPLGHEEGVETEDQVGDEDLSDAAEFFGPLGT